MQEYIKYIHAELLYLYNLLLSQTPENFCTLADVLAKISCSSIIFCTSPWKSLQVGHAEMTNITFIKLHLQEAHSVQDSADSQYSLRENLWTKIKQAALYCIL